MDKFLLNFDTFEIDNNSNTLKVYDYNSINFNEIKDYLNSLDKNVFEYIKIYDGSKIEKVCYDYYNTADYYDLILFLNNRDMIFDMPYDNDVTVNMSEDMIKDFEFRMFKNSKDEIEFSRRNALKSKVENDLTEKNMKLCYIKVIKNDYLNEVKRNIKKIIETQQNMFKLIDMLD